MRAQNASWSGQPNSYQLQPGYGRSPQYGSYRQGGAPAQNYNSYQSPEPYLEPSSSVVSCTEQLTAVVEVVGWTIGGGLKSSNTDLMSTTNDTIVNLKLGLRWNTARDTFYVGYGHALTGDVWYQNLVRAEYGIRF